MGVSRWAKSNKICLRTKHFQVNNRLFFRKNWKCRNRTTRTTQNSQFWVAHNHLFASCLPRNQENHSPKTDHSSPRQCELSHIGWNNCIFEHSKYRFDKSSDITSGVVEEAVDAFRRHEHLTVTLDPTQFVKGSKKSINQCGKSASTIGSNVCKSV